MYVGIPGSSGPKAGSDAGLESMRQPSPPRAPLGDLGLHCHETSVPFPRYMLAGVDLPRIACYISWSPTSPPKESRFERGKLFRCRLVWSADDSVAYSLRIGVLRV